MENTRSYERDLSLQFWKILCYATLVSPLSLTTCFVQCLVKTGSFSNNVLFLKKRNPFKIKARVAIWSLSSLLSSSLSFSSSWITHRQSRPPDDSCCSSWGSWRRYGCQPVVDPRPWHTASWWIVACQRRTWRTPRCQRRLGRAPRTSSGVLSASSRCCGRLAAGEHNRDCAYVLGWSPRQSRWKMRGGAYLDARTLFRDSKAEIMKLFLF